MAPFEQNEAFPVISPWPPLHGTVLPIGLHKIVQETSTFGRKA